MSSHPTTPEMSPTPVGTPAKRPPLTHRIYSHRLRVQANAYAQRKRLLSGTLVDIYVGNERRHWSMHRNLLCHHSESLHKELNASGPDTKPTSTIELQDYDPAGFELLVKWLYQGKIEDVSDIADPQRKYEYAVSCHKLYTICERFDMPQLKNIAIDQYRKGLHQARLVPDAEEINQIYRGSPVGSPFRALMTKIAARQLMDPDSDKDAEAYRECFENNTEFGMDIVNAVKWGTGGVLFDDPTTGDECTYHDHDNAPNCHIKGKGRSTQEGRKAAAKARTVNGPTQRKPHPITAFQHHHTLSELSASPPSTRATPNTPRKGRGTVTRKDGATVVTHGDSNGAANGVMTNGVNNGVKSSSMTNGVNGTRRESNHQVNGEAQPSESAEPGGEPPRPKRSPPKLKRRALG